MFLTNFEIGAATEKSFGGGFRWNVPGGRLLRFAHPLTSSVPSLFPWPPLHAPNAYEMQFSNSAAPENPELSPGPDPRAGAKTGQGQADQGKDQGQGGAKAGPEPGRGRAGKARAGAGQAGARARTGAGQGRASAGPRLGQGQGMATGKGHCQGRQAPSETWLFPQVVASYSK